MKFLILPLELRKNVKISTNFYRNEQWLNQL
ncbi:MAG: hypothetical protein ACI93N_001293 [Flavobacteriaceae bacterium]